MTNGNDNAFSSGNPEMDGREGLTKREYFAAMAMQGIAANGEYGGSYTRDAELAVSYAEYLIAALNENARPPIQTPATDEL